MPNRDGRLEEPFKDIWRLFCCVAVMNVEYAIYNKSWTVLVCLTVEYACGVQAVERGELCTPSAGRAPVVLIVRSAMQMSLTLYSTCS